MTAPLLLHVFQNFDTGGIQLRTVAFMNATGGHYRHRVIAWDGTQAAANGIAANVDMAFVAPTRLSGNVVRRMRQAAAIIAAQKPDLLLTYNWGAVETALANRLWSKRINVHHEAGFGLEEAHRQLPRRVWFRRLALRRCQRILAPSHYLLNIITETWKLPAAQIRLIPDGIDIARFSSPPDPAILPGFDCRAGELVIGTVTPLRREKNIGRFLRLVAGLRQRGLPLRAVVAGDGPERTALEAQAAMLGLAGCVHFAGFINRPEKIYGLFDLFAITSETEQLPNGVLQAMAAGRAIVGTDVGDVAHMVAPPNRPFIVPVTDEAALCNAAARLLENADWRASIGAANHAHVAHAYRLEDMVAAYQRAYGEALSCAS